MASGEQHKIQTVGVAFVKKFFETLNKSPDVLYKYFLAQGLFSYTDPSQTLTASGQEQIKDAFDSLDLANCRIGKIDLPRVVAQPLDDFVLVFTNGLWVNRSLRRFFASFCLQKRRTATGASYDVRNASFILLQEDDASPAVTLASPAAADTSSPAGTPSSPSPAQSTPAPDQAQAQAQAQAQVQAQAQAQAPTPAPAAAESALSPAAPEAVAEAAPQPEPVKATAPTARMTYAQVSSNSAAAPAPAAAPSSAPATRSKAPSKRPAARPARPAPATGAGAAAPPSSSSSAGAPEATASRSSPRHKTSELSLVLRGVPADCPQAEVLESFKNVGTVKSYSHDTSKSSLVFVRFYVADPAATGAQLTANPVLIRGARVLVELNRSLKKPRPAPSTAPRTADQTDKPTQRR